ncbi:MAG: hypothetical protein DYH20_07990 [Gammaproteobacteria bacterium PRO9]|nr:hypothetical protein [Gammaproteobacteria bacterium PRO9]
MRLTLFIALVSLAPAAHAYLDPSTGSMILSAIVGIFATLGLAIKTYWYKLKNLLKGSRATDPATDPAANPASNSGTSQQPAERQQGPGSDPG